MVWRTQQVDYEGQQLYTSEDAEMQVRCMPSQSTACTLQQALPALLPLFAIPLFP